MWALRASQSELDPRQSFDVFLGSGATVRFGTVESTWSELELFTSDMQGNSVSGESSL